MRDSNSDIGFKWFSRSPLFRNLVLIWRLESNLALIHHFRLGLEAVWLGHGTPTLVSPMSVSMIINFRIGIACTLGLIALAACVEESALPAVSLTPRLSEIEQVSDFQLALNRHDIALALPPKGKAIVVNVPAFELIAFEDAEPVLRSRVIAGSRRNPTPLIDTYTSTVRFRPSWRPTPEMVASGEYVDKRWPPGRKNPLGLAAIRLEPGLLVYLHDTNRRNLFEKGMRALSHGCIRVQRWDEVIAWLLDIDLDTVHRHANGRKTFDIPTDPVPVMIRYLTTFPGDDRQLEVFDDIYGREVKLADAQIVPQAASLHTAEKCLPPDAGE